MPADTHTKGLSMLVKIGGSQSSVRTCRTSEGRYKYTLHSLKVEFHKEIDVYTHPRLTSQILEFLSLVNSREVS